MEITISVKDGERDLELFYHWLRKDVDVARSAKVSVTGSADTGTGSMGTFETISMVVSNTTGLASLAIAYSSWRRGRKNPPPLTFTPTAELPPDQQAIVDELNRSRPDEK